MQNQDSIYNRRPWNEDEDTAAEPRVDYGIRFTDREQELTNKATMSVTMPGEYLADVVRPELPQVALFRPKYGYRTSQLSVYDVMDADRLYPEDTSGDDVGFSGTSRFTNGNGTWW